MSTLKNSIKINATPDKVWKALASMDVLHQYDPGVAKATLLSKDLPSGLGSIRQCDLKPKGWFRERVTEFVPEKSLTFELYECTLPVRKLRHRYEIMPDAGGTLVKQEIEYVLKFGVVGRLLDMLVVSKQFDKGIKSFFSGLKGYVEKDGL